MNPETLLSLIQLIRFGVDSIERISKGTMTEAELATEWAKVRGRIEGANALWEQAKATRNG